MDPATLVEYLEQFHSGHIPARCLCSDEIAHGTMCRVMTTQKGDQPRLLSNDLSRRTVFVAGQDTVCNILPCYSPYSYLRVLGMSHEYIVNKVSKENQDVWLVVFQAKVAGEESATHEATSAQGRTQPASGDDWNRHESTASHRPTLDEPITRRPPESIHLHPPANAKLPICAPATWQGILQLCRHFYPKAAEDVDRHLKEFSACSVEEYEQSENVKFLLLKGSPATCMTYERYLDLPTPRSAWHTRLFLYCEMRLFELFSGDGYTTAEQRAGDALESVPHSVRLREYVCENSSIGVHLENGTAALLKLQVVVPE